MRLLVRATKKVKVRMTDEELVELGKRLAKEHSDWFARVVQQIYHDAFLHGFKHAAELLLRSDEEV